MATRRITERVQRWLEGPVKAYPESSGGPAVLIQVCSTLKRSADSVVAVFDCERSTSDLAADVAGVVCDHAEGVTSRGCTYYLYAIGTGDKVLIQGFPVQVKPEDVESKELSAPHDPVSIALGQRSPEAASVAQTAVEMLRSDRNYSATLQGQNLATLDMAFRGLEKSHEHFAAIGKLLASQSEALLVQLQAANERAAAAEKRADTAERETRDIREQLRLMSELCDETLKRAEKAEKDKDDKENGMFAVLKEALTEKVLENLKGMDLGTALNGSAEGKPS